MDNSNNPVDTSNNTIDKIQVDMDLIKMHRQKLLDKFGHHPDLAKIGVFWYDVDKEKHQSVSIDEFKNN